jgi:hypothetical protein
MALVRVSWIHRASMSALRDPNTNHECRSESRRIHSRRKPIDRLDSTSLSTRQEPVHPHHALPPRHIPELIIPPFLPADLSLAFRISHSGRGRHVRRSLREDTGTDPEMPSRDLRGVRVEKSSQRHAEQVGHLGGIENGVQRVVSDEENDAGVKRRA